MLDAPAVTADRLDVARLDAALTSASPRRSPVPTPWPSVAIHGTVFALWVLLFAGAFAFTGVWAWSTGITYVLYDTALLAFVFVQTWHLRRARTPSAPAASRLTLAVIVAAHNEAAVLPVTLAALLAQTDVPDLIVIADDGSTDATATLLANDYGLVSPGLGSLSAESSTIQALRWLREPQGGKARVLNTAITLIDTDIVLTVDADTLLDPYAIAAMRAAFAAEPDLVAATGVLTPVCAPSLSGRIFEWFQTYEYIRNFLSRYAWMRQASLLLISGAFAGFRLVPLRDVGGFDPDCLVEDYELIHRLRRHGVLAGHNWTSRVLGDARAITDSPGTLAMFLRQRRRWFGGFLQTQYWYREMVGNARYGDLGLWMLPVKAADTLQPVFGLTAFALLMFYAVTGRLNVLTPVAAIIAAKIAIDLGFHLWSVHLYRRWTGETTRARMGPALLAAIVEPFSFQLLRHVGAVWGWVYFLTGRQTWGKQHRAGIV
jgi:cellulose synthase/poly-beta-1,6-N-acetylglucosamine synthase-like glycosyltransferase